MHPRLSCQSPKAALDGAIHPGHPWTQPWMVGHHPGWPRFLAVRGAGDATSNFLSASWGYECGEMVPIARAHSHRTLNLGLGEAAIAGNEVRANTGHTSSRCCKADSISYLTENSEYSRKGTARAATAIGDRHRCADEHGPLGRHLSHVSELRRSTRRRTIVRKQDRTLKATHVETHLLTTTCCLRFPDAYEHIAQSTTEGGGGGGGESVAR